MPASSAGTHSADLPDLTLTVEWAKACRLVRVSGGQLVCVKKHAGLLSRPARLRERMFEVFPLLGEALCPDGWGESLMRRHFREALDAVLLDAYRDGGTISVAAACARAWEVVTAPYFLGGASEQQLGVWRTVNDRDLRHALHTLERLGTLQHHDDDATTLTEHGWAAMRRVTGDALPGDAILQTEGQPAGSVAAGCLAAPARRAGPRRRARHALPDVCRRPEPLPARGLRGRVGLREPARSARRSPPRRAPRAARLARAANASEFDPEAFDVDETNAMVHIVDGARA